MEEDHCFTEFKVEIKVDRKTKDYIKENKND